MLHTLRKAFWLLGTAVFFAIIFLPGYTKLAEVRDKNHDLEVKIRKLNIENALLKEELHQIETDPFYQEKLAREKMGVVRKGEIPIKIIPAKKKK